MEVNSAAGIPSLGPEWDVALDLAWESARAGSLGVGAVVTDTRGQVVATGRNRILETDAGEDLLAGSIVAHAETNALAKLRWPPREKDGLVLWTTLEPCLMCSGAIRMSSVDEVRFLARDPLWEGMEALADLNEHVASRWPAVIGPHPDPRSVLGILLPAHLMFSWGFPAFESWMTTMPRTMSLAQELAGAEYLVRAWNEGLGVAEVASRLWDRFRYAAQDFANPGRL